MSTQAMSSTASVAQASRTCVQLNRADPLSSDKTISLDKPFFSISLPLSHPVFSSDFVDLLPPFRLQSGGIPLRAWSSDDNVTFVAHALGDDLCAEQLEVIWQCKLFAQGIGSDTISETTKAGILTVDGTEKVPIKISNGHAGEEHFWGWKYEHLKKFFVEYSRNSFQQAGGDAIYNAAERWRDLQMPRWLTAAELGEFCRPIMSQLDRSLRECIPVTKKEPFRVRKPAADRSYFTTLVDNGVLSRPTWSPIWPHGSHAYLAMKRRNSTLASQNCSDFSTHQRIFDHNKAWFRSIQGADIRKERARQNQKQSAALPTSIQSSSKHTPKGPTTALRETNGLSAAISKTTKPYHCISARFQGRKHLTEQVPLTQPTREFIAQKIEEQMSVPAQREAILHIIRSVSPREFGQRRNGRLLDWRNMTDRLYRELARLISDSSREANSTTNLKNPSTSLGVDDAASRVDVTPEMVRFTRENIAKLPAQRLKELAYITERTVPSLDALPPSAHLVVDPETLPVENQIMIWKYVKMHLPGEGDGEGEKGPEIQPMSKGAATMKSKEMSQSKDKDGTLTDGHAIGMKAGSADIVVSDQDDDDDDDFDIDLDADGEDDNNDNNLDIDLDVNLE